MSLIVLHLGHTNTIGCLQHSPTATAFIDSGTQKEYNVTMGIWCEQEILFPWCRVEKLRLL
jgi:hypothetical protein